MCIFVCIFFYINNTAKGNTSLMLNRLLLLLITLTILLINVWLDLTSSNVLRVKFIMCQLYISCKICANK